MVFLHTSLKHFKSFTAKKLPQKLIFKSKFVLVLS